MLRRPGELATHRAAAAEVMIMETGPPSLSSRDLNCLRLSIALRTSRVRAATSLRLSVAVPAAKSSRAPVTTPCRRRRSDQPRRAVVAAQAARRLTLPAGPVHAVHERRAVCMCSGAIYWTGIGRVVYALSGPHCSRSPATTREPDLVAAIAAKYSRGASAIST